MLCAAAAVTSCNTVTQTADTVAVGARVEQTPAVADLDVQPQRVTKSEKWRFRLIPWGEPTFAQRKKNLIYDMVDSAKADVLVEPQTRFTKKAFGPRTLTISGYPAKLKNFRTATPQDLEALRIVKGEAAPAPPQAAPAPAAQQPVAATAPRKRKAAKDGLRTMQKNVSYVRVGANFMTLKGDFAEDYEEAGNHMGYDLQFGWQHRIKNSNFYYGIEAGLSSLGFNYDYYYNYWRSESIFAHALRVSPINFGYKWNFAGKYVLDAHAGLHASYNYAGKGEAETRVSYVDWEGEYDGWDIGCKLGVGVWLGRVNVDFSWQRGFLDWQDGAHARNLTLSVAYAF